MDDKNKEERFDKDMDLLRQMFALDEDKYPMPASLKSENLRHLLPKEPDKMVFHLSDIADFLTRRRVLPVFSVVVAATLVIALSTKWNQYAGNLVPEAVSAAGMSNDVEAYAVDKADDEIESAEMIEKQVPETGGGEEDTTATPEVGMVPEGSPARGIVSATQQPKEVTDTTRANTTTILESGESAGDQTTKEGETLSIPKTEEDPIDISYATDTESTDVSSNTPAGAPPTTRSGPVGGSGASYYLDTWNNYGVYWRTSDPHDPDQSKYSVMLEFGDKQKDELYLQKGLSEMYQISYMAIKEDYVYLLGKSTNGTVLSIYSGLSSKTLTNVETRVIQGTVYDFFKSNGSVYLLTADTNKDNKYPGEQIVLENSAENGALILTKVDLLTTVQTQVSVIGTAGSSYRIDGNTVVITYSTTAKETKEKVVSFK